MILQSLLACGGDNSERTQARALLERISALDLRAPAAERARLIERLRAFAATDPALVRVRDQCAEAHAGLLSAELEQASARERLEAARARDGNPNKVELEAIAVSVAHASTTLRAAQAVLPECERSMRALATRPR
jgi:hypothetical protein